MNRKLIIVGLMMLFFVAIFGLTGCGLLSQAGDADLTNSVGSENGPGSGNWKPGAPRNNRQARQLVNVLQTLSGNAKEEAEKYDQIFVQCIDAGQLIEGKTVEECLKPIRNIALTLDNYFVDFDAGKTRYVNFYEENSSEELISPDDLTIGSPSNPLLTDLDVDGYHGECLTCTKVIDPGDVFNPVEIVLND